MKILRTMMMLALGILLVGTTAHATMILTLDDASTVGVDVIVTDNGLAPVNPIWTPNTADGNAVIGLIGYNGAIGAFNVNVTTGVSKPILGTPKKACIDVVSINISGGSGTLVVGLTDTDFYVPPIGSPPVFSLESAIGGTTGGTVTCDAYYDVLNREFPPMPPTLPVPVHYHPPSAFVGGATTIVPAVHPYSLTNMITIVHPAGSAVVTSFDHETCVNPVPEPGTLMLLGSGLLGIAGYARVKFGRKKKEA